VAEEEAAVEPDLQAKPDHKDHKARREHPARKVRPEPPGLKAHRARSPNRRSTRSRPESRHWKSKEFSLRSILAQGIGTNERRRLFPNPSGESGGDSS
jgi:hypothetical protein